MKYLIWVFTLTCTLCTLIMKNNCFVTYCTFVLLLSVSVASSHCHPQITEVCIGESNSRVHYPISLKGIVHPKIDFYFLFTYPLLFPNQFDFFFFLCNTKLFWKAESSIHSLLTFFKKKKTFLSLQNNKLMGLWCELKCFQLKSTLNSDMLLFCYHGFACLKVRM